MSDRDAAGINSPHNACMFRKDAEIARLRKVLGWVHGEWHDCEICKQLDVKNAEIARLRDVLASKGFVECGDAEIARLSEDAARYRLTPAVIECLKRGLNCWPEQNFADGAEIREILKQAEEVKLRIGEDV